MNAAPGGGLRAAGGLWGPPARALCETLGRRFPKRHRPTRLSPGADQENPSADRASGSGVAHFSCRRPQVVAGDNLGALTGQLGCRETAKGVDAGHPWGLRAVRLLQERQIPFEDHRLISSEEVDAFKAAHGVVTTPQLFAGQERIGGYTELATRLGVRPETAAISYAPVVAVFVTAGLMALVLSAGFSGSMGIAICLLAMLKLMDVEAFAASFRKYDLLTQRWRAWGRLYPGIELLVGLGILLQPHSTAAAQLVGAVAVWLGGMGMVSVGKAVFLDHLALNCACVGGNSKTPLGLVSFAENLIMAAMGAAMLAGG